MKTILVATDFSAASRNAALYGLEIAKILNAKIILFNAYKVPSPAAGLGVSVSRYDIMMQTDKRLLEEADFLDPKLDIIEILCDEGLPEEAIINIANEKKVDFIITGMKGSGKNVRKIFGSTATELARKTNIPVIIIPENAKYSTPKILVYASDIVFGTNVHAIDQIKAITRSFNSKLYVVSVIKDGDEFKFEVVNGLQKLKKELEVLDTEFKFPVDTDISHGLDDFIKTHNVDMLLMMPHKHEWAERLFKKSETKDMIFHTEIPLLILPELSIKTAKNTTEKIITETSV